MVGSHSCDHFEVLSEITLSGNMSDSVAHEISVLSVHTRKEMAFGKDWDVI